MYTPSTHVRVLFGLNQCSYGVKASCGESPPPSRLGGLRRRLGGLRRRLGGLKRLGGPK